MTNDNHDPNLEPELIPDAHLEEPETETPSEADTEPLMEQEPEPDPHGEANIRELRRRASNMLEITY